MKQYEVWWVDLPEPAGRRPVLLLSRDRAYQYLNKVIVVEITTAIRGIPQELALGRAEGLPQLSVASFDNMRRIGKERLYERVGRLDSSRVPALKRALGYAFTWPELMNL